MVLAIKDNEIRANYLGINVSKQIHNIYIISGVLASLGGALMVILVGHVTPEDTAYWTKSGEFVFVAILSGVMHVIAPLLGSLFFEFIRSFALYFSKYLANDNWYNFNIGYYLFTRGNWFYF